MPNANSGASLGRLAAGAAVGLVAGLAIPHARKLAMQAPSMAAGDWIAALTKEHRMVEKMFDQLLKTTEHDFLKREALLAKIAYALNKHAVEEENVIYPALSENGFADQSKHLADEHLTAKTSIYDLRRLSSKDPAWLAKAQELWSALETHIHEEEDDIFPAFRDKVSSDEMSKLTLMMDWEGLKVA